MAALIAVLARLQFKRDPGLIVFAVLLVGVTCAAVVKHYLTPGEGVAFLSGALAMPGLFGRSKDDSKEKKESKSK